MAALGTPPSAVTGQVAGTVQSAPPTPHQSLLRQDLPYLYSDPANKTVLRFPNLTVPLKWRAVAIQAGGARQELEVEAASWDDVDSILTGSLTCRDLTFGTKQPRMGQGDRVMLECDEGAGFKQVWTMRCGEPTLTASNNQRTFAMTNDLDLLNRSMEQFIFHSDRLHPHGWRSDQIILKICRDYDVPIDPGRDLVKGHLMPWGTAGHPNRMNMTGSPLDMIRNVVKWERRGHGTRLVIRFDNGHLSVLPLTRSKDLLLLGPSLIEAQLQSLLPPEFASSVMFRANLDHTDDVSQNDSKGRKKITPSKMHILVESPASVRRFGYVRRAVFSPDAASTAEMLAQAQLWLATVARPLNTVTLTHKGIPHLKRGDAIQLAIGDWGLRRAVVFVNQVHHSLTPTDYRMEVQCIFADPYLDRRGLKITYLLKDSAAAAQGFAGMLANQGTGSPQKNDTPPAPMFGPSPDLAPTGTGQFG